MPHGFSRMFILKAMLRLRPAQLMLGSFIVTIALGTSLLMLPAATHPGQSTGLIDALFTATSATCVTGLAVQNTATHFSGFGKTIILLLIQVGGLGIMTFSVFFVFLTRRALSMRNQSIMQDVLDQESLSSARQLIRFIFIMTILLETTGTLLLFGNWYTSDTPPLQTLGHALFHSISAFCNAGFSTFSANLEPFALDRPTNFIISVLIILGGLGFVVISDLYQALNQRIRRRTPPHRFRIQSRVVLSWTGALLLLGTALIFILERHRLFAGHSTPDALLLSFFQSVTTRTAGFNTCANGVLQASTLLVCIVLMFAGASPGGTGGGVKTTTLATLGAFIRAGFRNRPNAELYRRTIPTELIQRAVMVLCSSLLIVFAATILLCTVEAKPFMPLFFECVSAFATAGLSTGITPHLSATGRIILILLMFIGRLGPLTIGFALILHQRQPARYTYATERIMIG